MYIYIYIYAADRSRCGLRHEARASPGRRPAQSYPSLPWPTRVYPSLPQATLVG